MCLFHKHINKTNVVSDCSFSLSCTETTESPGLMVTEVKSILWHLYLIIEPGGVLWGRNVVYVLQKYIKTYVKIHEPQISIMLKRDMFVKEF